MNDYEDNVLYEDGMYRITQLPRSHEDYNLWVGEGNSADDRDYFLLARGMLEEIGKRAKPERAVQMMDAASNGTFSYCLKERGCSGEGLIVACARACIKNMEDLFYDAAKEAREYKDQLKEIAER
jgi:hypothetical protein